MLERRRLGQRSLSVTRLGFGGGAIGKLDPTTADGVAEATIAAAWRAGIRYFDTAPLYGLGHSERRLGRFLRRQPRDSFVLSTKVGRLVRPGASGGIAYDYSRDGTLRSLDESFERLGLERIDIALVHDIDRYTHGDAQPARLAAALDGALPALLSLREQGAIGAVGLGVNEWQVCREVALRCEIDCLLLAGRYTLLEQGAAEFLPFCRERGISLIIGGPFNSGILATGSAGAGTYNYRPPPADVLDRVRRLETVLAAFDVPLPRAALHYPLGEPAVATVIPGMASPAEVAAAVDHLRRPVPEAAWAALRDEGLSR